MKVVPVRDSLGMFLAHDMTEIIPGKFKGAAFKKGHIVEEKDIPRLLNMGKEHIAIIEFNEGTIHEDDAAIRLAKAALGCGVVFQAATEGKVNILAAEPGLLKINYQVLQEINELGEMMMATLHTDMMVAKGTLVAATRIIPLSIENEELEIMEKLCAENEPIVQVLPLKKFKVGVVTTGNEIYYGRIEDKFGDVIREKFSELDSHVFKQVFSRDDSDMIAQCILDLIEEGADIVTVTGGMSVDPDDVTPEGIRKSGAKFVSYGAPTLPGAMFLVSYIGEIPVLGLPGCIMYSRRTVFDLVVPKLMVGEKLTLKDISKLGHGGLCSSCAECHYPNCGFGKGGLS
ncbi:molybdopterin-binding protein [Acetobacterium bakii]|uniref:Molybdopterin molybdenumtransferase n=1 Tax=Acetobacterium bakii TaxID=52689 RepID=A0A0L6U4S4_9FIRM|nr:molybdopterin-binding protein [Acetobacterium bakii]KNZ43524.1 molybdopterin-binding protein [Acetobacterium bakii]